MSEPRINVNISGGNNQNHFGEGDQYQTVNQSTTITINEFLTAVRDGVAQAAEPEAQRIEQEVLAPLREIASAEEPASEQDRVTLKARIMALVEQLSPYAPYVRKTIAAFAEGALMTIPPPASWVVAGCIEVVRDARNRD